MDLSTFLTADIATVRAVCPPTVLYTAGGTRRAAALAGIDLTSSAYPDWTLQRMWHDIGLLAEAGVQHLLITAVWRGQFAERTPHYREYLFQWMIDGLTGPQAQAHYAQLAAAPHLLYADDPALAPLAGCGWPHVANPRLHLWWHVTPDPEIAWRAVGRAGAAGAQSQAQMIAAVCGMDVPPAGLWISYGKPMADFGIVPPVLIGNTSAYWTQRPGYALTGPVLRRIIYDYAFCRTTWRGDKSDRYAHIDQLQGVALDHIVGLGRRIGPFWIADERGPYDEATD